MRARFILPGILLLACTFSSAHAQTKAVKIGVLKDQSGVYADDQGIGSMIAAQLAVEDFPSKSGMPVEVTTADHQNKVDIGTTIARRWLEREGVDADVIRRTLSEAAIAADQGDEGRDELRASLRGML